MRASLFITCVTDTLFPATGQAVVSVLEGLDVEVDFPVGQTCCGQIQANSGYGPDALGLIRRFVKVFEDAEAIVTPSASCAAMVVEQYPRLAREAGDRNLMAAVQALVPRVHEFTSFLVDTLEIDDVGARFPHKVAYHPTCHGLRMLKLGDAPTRLLRSVQDLELVELPQATTCCGFGGTFAVRNEAVSTAMLADKMANISASDAEFVTATDNSCLMHIGGGLSRLRRPVRAIHIAEILASKAPYTPATQTTPATQPTTAVTG